LVPETEVAEDTPACVFEPLAPRHCVRDPRRSGHVPSPWRDLVKVRRGPTPGGRACSCAPVSSWPASRPILLLVEDRSNPVVVISAATQVLAHAPGLARHGSKPSRELGGNAEVERAFLAALRSFGEAVAY